MISHLSPRQVGRKDEKSKAINNWLSRRHVILSGHNSLTAWNLVLYHGFLENRHPKLFWDSKIIQFGPAWEM